MLPGTLRGVEMPRMPACPPGGGSSADGLPSAGPPSLTGRSRPGRRSSRLPATSCASRVRASRWPLAAHGRPGCCRQSGCPLTSIPLLLPSSPAAFVEIMAPAFQMAFFDGFIRPTLYNAHYGGWPAFAAGPATNTRPTRCRDCSPSLMPCPQLPQGGASTSLGPSCWDSPETA